MKKITLQELMECVTGLEFMIQTWMSYPREGDGALLDKIEHMKELDIVYDGLKDVLKPITEAYDKLRLFDIPDAMADQGTTSIKNARFGRCTVTSDMYVSVLDKAKLHEWLKEGGNGALIVPTVNAQTLKAFVKEQLTSTGEVPPDDIVSVKPFSRAVIYKS